MPQGVTRRSTGHQKRAAFGSLRWRSGAGYLSVIFSRDVVKTETIKNVAGVIILGAIGSGIWSLAGEPALQWCVDIFISSAQRINDGYYDQLHQNIGKGLHESNAVFFRVLFSATLAMAVLILPFMALKIHRRAINIESGKLGTDGSELSISSEKRRAKYFFIFTTIYALVAFPFMVSRIITQTYNNDAIVFVERSIDILSPSLTRQEILQLRASYRLVSDASSFYELHDEIIDYGKTKSLEIPSFDVAR